MHSVKFYYAPSSFNDTYTFNDIRNFKNYNLRNVAGFAETPTRVEGFRKFPLYSFKTLGMVQMK
jgi:hypothetical protein